MDFVFCGCRFDGLFGRFPIGKMCFEKCIFFTSFLLFYNISSALVFVFVFELVFVLLFVFVLVFMFAA